MFDLGIQELIVIFVVALLVFGPKRLPEIAQAMGKGLAEMKRALSGVKEQIDSELHEVKEIKDLKDLDPIALKNELFKNEELIKVEDENPPTPQKSGEPGGEGPGAVQEKKDEQVEQSPEQHEQKGSG